MADVFLNVLPIFVITMLGSVIRSYWLKSDEFWQGVESLTYFMLFPIVLFNYISTAELQAGDLLKLNIVLIFATTIAGLLLILYKKFTKMENVIFTSVFQGGLRYNNYIFFGVAGALYGDEGLKVAAVIAAYMIIFTNIISVFVFNTYVTNVQEENTRSKRWWLLLRNICSNPMILASAFGGIFNLLDLELNTGLHKTFDILSDSALALGVMNVGAGLRFVLTITDIKAIAVASISKLLILPIITFATLNLFALDDMTRSIGMVFGCLPCASSSYILSKQLGGDPESMATIVTFTTLMSMFSLSLMIYLLN